MLPWDKKKTASHIVGRIKPDGMMAYGGEVKNEESFDDGEPLLSVAQELLAAIESKSAKGISSCLRILVQKIQDEDRKEDEETFEPKE